MGEGLFHFPCALQARIIAYIDYSEMVESLDFLMLAFLNMRYSRAPFLMGICCANCTWCPHQQNDCHLYIKYLDGTK